MIEFLQSIPIGIKILLGIIIVFLVISKLVQDLDKGW
jgi:hypothetical protein